MPLVADIHFLPSAAMEAVEHVEKVRVNPGNYADKKKFAVRETASPKLWMDAYLAAFALAGRYRIVTTDAGFRQFQGIDLLVLGQGGTQ